MKLDYLHNATCSQPIVRLYDFTANEASDFMKAIEALASERERTIPVHTMAGVAAINGCQLTLVRKSWDQAILKTGATDFECGFTAGTWNNVAGLLETFAAGSGGFPFLAGRPGEADLLFSESGSW